MSKWLSQDRSRRMTHGADSTTVKFLTLDEVCDRYIRCTLNRCGGNREATARALGIGRTSLYRYLKKLDREKREGATGILR
jgi:DNA-binding NtrC family response regulator